MKKLLSGLFAVALGAVLLAGCGESPTSDRLGERPGDVSGMRGGRPARATGPPTREAYFCPPEGGMLGGGV